MIALFKNIYSSFAVKKNVLHRRVIANSTTISIAETSIALLIDCLPNILNNSMQFRIVLSPWKKKRSSSSYVMPIDVHIYITKERDNLNSQLKKKTRNEY